ncbi:MAG: hypothetical protein M1816_007536 [Peltula sp. TS41687]|nr:MAG: hypothetical protein M1816_007536 [Peltula sp. TS41687]
MDPPSNNPSFILPPGITPIIVRTTNPNPNNLTSNSGTLKPGRIYITKDPKTHRPVMVRKRPHGGLTSYLAASIAGPRLQPAKPQSNAEDPAPPPAQVTILAPQSLPQLQLISQSGLFTYKPAESSSRVQEVKEEPKEDEKEKEKEKPSGDGDKKEKEDPPKTEDAPAPEKAEAPPPSQEATGKALPQQVCAGCGKIRSASYHYRLQQRAGADPPPNYCRKCINEITSSEEDDDDNAIEERRLLERRQRDQLKLRLDSLKHDAVSSASSEESLHQERRKQRRDSSHRERAPGRRIQVLISDGEDDDRATGVMIMRERGPGLVKQDRHHSDVERFEYQPSRKRPTRSRSSSAEDRARSSRTSRPRHVREHKRGRRPSLDYQAADAERRPAANPLPYRHGYFQEVDHTVVEGRLGRQPILRRRSYSMHEKGVTYEQRTPELHHRYQDTHRHAEEVDEDRYVRDRRSPPPPPPPPPPRRARAPGRAGRYDPRDEEDRYWDSDVAEVGDHPARVRFRQEDDVVYSRKERPRREEPYEAYPVQSTRFREQKRYVAPNYNHIKARQPGFSDEEGSYGSYSPSDDNSSLQTQRRYSSWPARAPSPPRSSVPQPPPRATSTARPRYIARHAYVEDEDEEISRAMRDARLQGRGERRYERKVEREERSRSPSLLTSAWESGRKGNRGGFW